VLKSQANSLLNRGKSCVQIDLKSPDGVAEAWSLIAQADVIVENFSPGTMSALGLGAEAVRALYPVSNSNHMMRNHTCNLTVLSFMHDDAFVKPLSRIAS